MSIVYDLVQINAFSLSWDRMSAFVLYSVSWLNGTTSNLTAQDGTHIRWKFVSDGDIICGCGTPKLAMLCKTQAKKNGFVCSL